MQRRAALRLEKRSLLQPFEHAFRPFLISRGIVIAGITVVVRAAHAGHVVRQPTHADHIIAGGRFSRRIFQRSAHRHGALPAHRDLVFHAATLARISTAPPRVTAAAWISAARISTTRISTAARVAATRISATGITAPRKADAAHAPAPPFAGVARAGINRSEERRV